MTPNPAALPSELRTASAIASRAVREILPTAVHRLRSRIGDGLGGGFYPAAHRYHLYLSSGCPLSLRVAIVRSLLGLEKALPVTLLPPAADADDGRSSLRSAYESTAYHYDGPLTVPVLTDRWSGRIVNNHAPDIIRDLATCFGEGHDNPPSPVLCPDEHTTGIDALAELIDEDVTEAARRAGRESRQGDGEAVHTLLEALGYLEKRLDGGPYLFGEGLTTADVHLWVALVHLDPVHRRHLDVDAVQRIAGHDGLWSYCRELYRHPAFRSNLRADHVIAQHWQSCREPEASGILVPLLEWEE